MKYQLDPEFQACVRQTFEAVGVSPDQPTPRFPRGDVESRRKGASFASMIIAREPEAPNVQTTRHVVRTEDAYEMSILEFRKTMEQKSTELDPAILYLHGGGMIFGSAELFEPATKTDVAATGVAHFSVNYRVAPEVTHPTPAEDCYAALLWLYKEATRLGIDNSRIAVVGLSAGGGLAAAVALMARDRGLKPPLAKQILLSPMLDDHNLESTDDELAPFSTWSWDDNWTGWNALLKNKAGSEGVSPYAAPARAESLINLPSAYIDVGTLDIFAKENEEYASRLKKEGVQVEWHLYKGVPHGFEFRGRLSKIHQEAQSNRHKAMRSF